MTIMHSCCTQIGMSRVDIDSARERILQLEDVDNVLRNDLLQVCVCLWACPEVIHSSGPEGHAHIRMSTLQSPGSA